MNQLLFTRNTIGDPYKYSLEVEIGGYKELDWRTSVVSTLYIMVFTLISYQYRVKVD